MVIDLSPLLRGERGETIPVAGVRVGDPAAGVKRRVLTGAEEAAPGESRTYSNDTVYRTRPDGTLVEVPLAERIDATPQGGVLRCGEIALSVGGGVIERIFVRGPSLASLGIAREEDIAARFGPATGREHLSLGWRIHHYPERGLAVAWHEREGRVEHVQLGAEPWHELDVQRAGLPSTGKLSRTLPRGRSATHGMAAHRTSGVSTNRKLTRPRPLSVCSGVTRDALDAGRALDHVDHQPGVVAGRSGGVDPGDQRLRHGRGGEVRTHAAGRNAESNARAAAGR